MSAKKPVVLAGVDGELEQIQSADVFYIPRAIYLNGVEQVGQSSERTVNNVTVGAGGLWSVFLTSDGFTKSGANTFIYATFLGVTGAADNTLNTTANAIISGETNYNVTTGQLQIHFLENKTTGVLIGGNVTGLQDAPSGTTVTVTYKGIL